VVASTYAAGLRARLDQQHQKGFGQPGFLRTEQWHEEQYQAKLMGGYKRETGTCDRCFTIRSANDTCNCE